MLRRRAKEHQIGGPTSLYSHDYQVALPFRSNAQNLAPRLSMGHHAVCRAVLGVDPRERVFQTAAAPLLTFSFEVAKRHPLLGSNDVRPVRSVVEFVRHDVKHSEL